MTTQKITPFLWFDDNAEQAVELYCSMFAGSKVTQVARYGEGTPGRAGAVMTIAFEIAGQQLVALNGGPHYKLTPAASLFVSCDSQAEVDRYWERFLATGGRESRCGWLEDKFGLSWQIIPRRLVELMSDPDPKRAGRVAQAMMTMQKIDIAALERAYEGA